MISRDMARAIRNTNFKNGLCEIDSDGRILHGGFHLFLAWSTEARRLCYSNSPRGGVHVISAGGDPGVRAIQIRSSMFARLAAER